MSTSHAIAHERPRLLRIPSLGELVGWGCLVASLLVLGMAVEEPSRIRLAVAVAVVVLMVGIGTKSPTASLLILVVWLTALGMTRRIVSELAPITRTDPLLLVSPLVLVLLAAAAIRQGALRNRTTLTTGVLALSVLSLLAAINPLQGSLVGGIGGLLFVWVPMLAFWIGRSYLDDRALRMLLKLVAALGVVTAVYGLVQTLSGFPSWDQQWINDVTYQALNVGDGVIRPFSTYSSAAEYGMFTALAIVVWLAMARRPLTLPLMVGALSLLVPALVLESSRGVIVVLIATLGLLVGAYRGLPIAVSAGIGVLLLAALVLALRSYGPSAYSSTTTGTLVSHQVEGLANPLNPQTSTAGIHLAMIENGIKQAFLRPAGQGLETVTIAGAKFGGVTKGTESDPSNAGVAMGLPGLLAYLTVFLVGMTRLYGIAQRRRDGLALAALGVVTVTAFQWLDGGQYAVATLPWLVLGWADRPARKARDPKPGEQSLVVPSQRGR